MLETEVGTKMVIEERNRDISRDKDGDWRKKDEYKNKGGLYISSRNHSMESGNSRMEVLLGKLVKGLESLENCLKEIREDISGMIWKVKSYATAIKYLEQ